MADQRQPSGVCQLPSDEVGGESTLSTACISDGERERGRGGESMRDGGMNRQGRRRLKCKSKLISDKAK